MTTHRPAVLSVLVLVAIVVRVVPALAAEPPAAITDQSRDVDQTNDFLRLIFLPPGVKPTTLGAPAALRVFVGASTFFRPPLSVADPARADVVRRRYGIFPAFSGLGFSVKGSGDGAPMLGADILRRSVVPEYLLKNVTLAAGGCRCISVPPYPGREAAPLDPEQIT